MICVETRHMRAVLQAQINKTDRNDARGIAQMMRAGLYRPVHVKTLRGSETANAADPSQTVAVQGHRHQRTIYEVLWPELSASRSEWLARVRFRGPHPGACREHPRRALREQIVILYRRLLAIVRDDAGVPAPDDGSWCRRDNFIMLTISRVRRLSVTVFIPVTGKRSL